ncbi:uncharacterized protein PRD47_004046 [Ara ararauna]
MNIEVTNETTLVDTQVHCIPTNMTGPIGDGLSALLLGRSSTMKREVFVMPGVIDADYTGAISVMVWTPNPPVMILKGSKIGQLIPFRACVPLTAPTVRGDKGFGSTGAPELYLVLVVTNQWKKLP